MSAQVGWFFNKIQCFCFEEQRLRPKESIDMPVFFYIDPEFATDRRLKNVDHITLSYVFFKTGELPKNADGSELTPGESMPAHLLPSSSGVGGGDARDSGDGSGGAKNTEARQGGSAGQSVVAVVERGDAEGAGHDDADVEEREAAAAVA